MFKVTDSEVEYAFGKAIDGWLYLVDLTYAWSGYRGARFKSAKTAYKHAEMVVGALLGAGLITRSEEHESPGKHLHVATRFHGERRTLQEFKAVLQVPAVAKPTWLERVTGKEVARA